MKTFALIQGDFATAPGGYRMYTGAQKIHQDISLALQEAYGGDALHPAWGSILSNFIGQPLTAEMRQAILTEANRILNNYISVQNARILQDNLTGSVSGLTTDDVVNSVTGLSVKQSKDSVVLSIGLQTISRQQININQIIS